MIIYPNPSNGKFHIDFLDVSNLSNLSIINEAGNIVQQAATVRNKIISVDLSDLNQGLYTIKVEHEGRIMTKRIMIKNRA